MTNRTTKQTINLGEGRTVEADVSSVNLDEERIATRHSPQIAFRLPEETRVKLELLAQRHGMSVSALARVAVEGLLSEPEPVQRKTVERITHSSQ